MLSVSFLMICWVSLCWVASCWTLWRPFTVIVIVFLTEHFQSSITFPGEVEPSYSGVVREGFGPNITKYFGLKILLIVILYTCISAYVALKLQGSPSIVKLGSQRFTTKHSSLSRCGDDDCVKSFITLATAYPPRCRQRGSTGQRWCQWQGWSQVSTSLAFPENYVSEFVTRKRLATSVPFLSWATAG